jgi:hypothetical protein
VTSWAPIPVEGTAVPLRGPGRGRAAAVLRRVASIVVAALAAYLLLTPLLDALSPGSTSSALDRYATGARPEGTRVTEGGFAVAFPEAPDRSAHHGTFDGVTVGGASYEDDPATGYRFLVTYLDLPVAAAGRDREVVDAALASSARSFGGTLASHTDTVVDGNRAVEFVVRDDAGAFRGRIMLVGTRLYVYGVQSPAGHDALFDRFASSFALLAD